MRVEGYGDLSGIRKTGKSNSRSTAADLVNTGSTASSQSTGDGAEISSSAKLLGKLASTTDLRQDKVDAIQAQIESGEYLTDEKVADGISKMLSEL